MIALTMPWLKKVSIGGSLLFEELLSARNLEQSFPTRGPGLSRRVSMEVDMRLTLRVLVRMFEPPDQKAQRPSIARAMAWVGRAGLAAIDVFLTAICDKVVARGIVANPTAAQIPGQEDVNIRVLARATFAFLDIRLDNQIRIGV